VRARALQMLCTPLLVAACVTVNIYFPEAAAEKAADRIIEDVWGPEPGAPGGAQDSESRPAGPASRMVAGLVDLLVPAAAAQEPDINVETPAIRRVTASMRERHRSLVEHWNSGALGLASDGLVALRDPKAVALRDRKEVQRLVAEENRDREALYREVARANGRPEWEAAIRETFARRWVKNAESGWWYERGGEWRRK